MDDRTQGSGGPNRIQSVQTAFTIIESLLELDGCGVSDLARHLDIPKSTAHIYLDTLRETGFVVKSDGQYRVGLRFLECGGRVRQSNSVYQAAKPEIDELSEKTGEIANLGVVENGKRVLLYTSETSEGVFDNSPTGEFTHMHWTALGKAMLARMPRSRVEQIIDQHGLPEGTLNTITDQGSLIDELEQIRERGYSIEDGERREGIKALGVPIVERGNQTVAGAVSISGPKRRVGDESAEAEIVDAIRSTVNIIELKIQHY